MDLTLALGQMDIVLGDARANLQAVETMAVSAAEKGSRLLVLPELWGSGYKLECARDLADEIGTGLFASMAALAREHRLAICGSLLEWDKASQQTYNTAVLVDSSGRLCGRYRKVHPIGLMEEDKYLGSGDRAPVFNLPWCKGAMAICYDLRFPEQFRGYALNGAALVLLPAEWPQARIEHWRALLKARAIENQCFMIACNRVGADRANIFGGRSSVIDPLGNVLAESGTDPELLIVTIDLEMVDKTRKDFPVLHDRRPEVYHGESMLPDE